MVCVESTAAFFASHSWQQIFCSSGILWAGKEWKGIGLPAWGEREALGMWVFKSSWHDWLSVQMVICITIIVAVMPAIPLVCLSTGIIVGS